MTHLIQQLIIILLKLPQRGEMKMAVIILVVAWLLLTMSSTIVASLFAKPGCQEQCGNVNIQFPFGIGSSHCFLNKWFQVSCDNSTTPPLQPFLKHPQLQLQILNMSLSGDDQWVQVSNHISFFDCVNKTTNKFANLTGSSFHLSDVNTFIAATCGDFARIEDSRNGCSSSRNDCPYDTADFIDFINCNGMKCCRSVINSSSDSSLRINMFNSTHDSCKYAFIIDTSEIDKFSTSHYNDYFTKGSIDVDYAPVQLSWRLNMRYFDLYNTHHLPTESFYCKSDSHYSLNSSMNRIFTCHCNKGFRGNPYILLGCQDINECDDQKVYRCNKGTTCINTNGGYHCSYTTKFILLIGFGSGLGVLFLVVSTWRSYKFIKKRNEIKRKKAFFIRNGGLLLEQQIHSGEKHVEKTKLFKSKELEKATNNFSKDRILGQGGQGTVYKGMLEDGKIVAVKKSKIVDEAKLSEFINEVVILTQINHRNVVKLLGCCLETDVPVLVYEFVPNGTLSQYIHDTSVEFLFTWNMRLRIATEVAGALSYLHSAASFPIYHRDVKSTNILLDEKLRAKVADFGTSRTISLEQTHLTTLVYGTFGYLDPEYFQSSQFTDKSDVYSFGVILVELLTGQKAISTTRSDEEGRSLATYFIMMMEDESNLFDILDSQVLKDAPKEDILIFAHLAKRCLHLNGRNRPTMKEVATELEQVIDKDSNGSQHINEELEYAESQFECFHIFF